MTESAWQAPAPPAYSSSAAAPPQPVVAAKSPGIAVLLTFFWLGAGHLYAGRIATGVLLVLWTAFLWLGTLSFWFIFTIPLWVVTAPLAMWMAARAAKAFNRRNGIVVR